MDEELTAVEVDDLLAAIADFEKKIKSAESERDALIAHYQEKIFAAGKIFEDKTAQVKLEIASLTERLRRYAVANLPDNGRRSLVYPSGKLAFRKQPPKFFFDDLTEANGRDERIIHFVKHNAHRFLKVKVEESVDWAQFKTKLSYTGDAVVYKETGEIIDGLHAHILPDKFTVTTS